MSPVLAAALARAEAADAGLAFDLGLAVDADASSAPLAPEGTPPRRVSTTLGRFLGWSGCRGHSAQRGEGRRS